MYHLLPARLQKCPREFKSISGEWRDPLLMWTVAFTLLHTPSCEFTWFFLLWKCSLLRVILKGTVLRFQYLIIKQEILRTVFSMSCWFFCKLFFLIFMSSFVFWSMPVMLCRKNNNNKKKSMLESNCRSLVNFSERSNFQVTLSDGWQTCKSYPGSFTDKLKKRAKWKLWKLHNLLWNE